MIMLPRSICCLWFPPFRKEYRCQYILQFSPFWPMERSFTRIQSITQTFSQSHRRLQYYKLLDSQASLRLVRGRYMSLDGYRPHPPNQKGPEASKQGLLTRTVLLFGKDIGASIFRNSHPCSQWKGPSLDFSQSYKHSVNHTDDYKLFDSQASLKLVRGRTMSLDSYRPHPPNQKGPEDSKQVLLTRAHKLGRDVF